MVVKSLDYSRRLKPTSPRQNVRRPARQPDNVILVGAGTDGGGLANGKAWRVSLDDAELMLAVELSQILTCVLVKIKCNLSRKSFDNYQFNIIIKHKNKNLLIFNTNFTISK